MPAPTAALGEMVQEQDRHQGVVSRAPSSTAPTSTAPSKALPETVRGSSLCLIALDKFSCLLMSESLFNHLLFRVSCARTAMVSVYAVYEQTE